MSDIAIRVEGLSKRYRIGARQERYYTLRDTLTEAVARPFQKLASFFGTNGSGSPTSSASSIWALKDVSFAVKRGEAVGVIGRNGAGKSTLLKILSRITEPTEGRAQIHGRIGSLLEVGTGFHPELTGRENIYLNGAILGMKKVEIDRKFDEIVAFSEVEQFIDTPVKHYSSGMYLRLAFGVAAHLEPEILIVDEVLAVGDNAFQKKCLQKIGDVAKKGRTVLFVSHNLGAVIRLCDRCIWLNEGRVVRDGVPSEIVNAYLKEGTSNQAERHWSSSEAPGDDSLRLSAVRVCQPAGIPNAAIDITKPFDIEIETEVLRPTLEVTTGVRVLTADGYVVLTTTEIMNGEQRAGRRGRRLSVCHLPAYTLNAGTYVVSVGADVPNIRVIFYAENVLSWSVEAISPEMARYNPQAWTGVIGPGLAEWSVREAVELEDSWPGTKP
jgi:lipopolysaccharide transport system ATP-binding protein